MGNTASAAAWPEVEHLTLKWLRDRTGRPVYTETDTGLTDHLPALQVARVGGSDGAETSRHFDLEVTAIAAARHAALTLAGEAYAAMKNLATAPAYGWYVDEVQEIFGAAIIPTGNPGHRAATATYRITVRPHQAPRP